MEKAEAKIQSKLEKKEKLSQTNLSSSQQNTMDNGMNSLSLKATASQMTNKKASKLLARGLNRSMDIRIENFDISFGDK